MAVARRDQAFPSQDHASPEGFGQLIPSSTTALLWPPSQMAFAKVSAGGPGALICCHVLPLSDHASFRGKPCAPMPAVGLKPVPPKTKSACCSGFQTAAALPRAGGLGSLSIRCQVVPSHEYASPQ